MTIEIRTLGPTDAAVLEQVAPDVFDNPVDTQYYDAARALYAGIGGKDESFVLYSFQIEEK